MTIYVRLSIEMLERGFTFGQLNLYKATEFLIENTFCALERFG